MAILDGFRTHNYDYSLEKCLEESETWEIDSIKKGTSPNRKPKKIQEQDERRTKTITKAYNKMLEKINKIRLTV